MKYFTLILQLSAITCFGQQPTKPSTVSHPLFEMKITHTPTSVQADGRSRIVFELHCRNNGNRPLLLHTLELINNNNETVILKYEDQALRSMTASLVATPKPEIDTTLKPDEQKVIYIEAEMAAAPFPEFYLSATTIAPGGTDQLFYNTSDPISVNNSTPVQLGSPLRGGNWAAIHDPSWQRGHRRVFYSVDGQPRIPGRFAIDFVKVDEVKYAKGNEDIISNWFGYAQDVLAVADGEVSSVKNDFPESPTLSANPDYDSSRATGNYISLKIAENRYVFYEHLKPGSILVQPGQQVTRGQVIAKLGFTGQTTGPHLHLHVADKDSPLGAEGLPFVFDRFTQTGSYPDFSKFGKAPFKKERKSVSNEFPPSNSVLYFGL